MLLEGYGCIKNFEEDVICVSESSLGSYFKRINLQLRHIVDNQGEEHWDLLWPDGSPYWLADRFGAPTLVSIWKDWKNQHAKLIREFRCACALIDRYLCSDEVEQQSFRIWMNAGADPIKAREMEPTVHLRRWPWSVAKSKNCRQGIEVKGWPWTVEHPVGEMEEELLAHLSWEEQVLYTFYFDRKYPDTYMRSLSDLVGLIGRKRLDHLIPQEEGDERRQRRL